MSNKASHAPAPTVTVPSPNQYSVIVTYRCNARCSMCNIWKHPSRIEDEISPKALDRLPSGVKHIVISGGEPTLRRDLDAIVDILAQKANRLQLITNGTLHRPLVALARRHPTLSIRISIDGIAARHDRIRGIPYGYENALRILSDLKAQGLSDLGIATTVSGQNVRDTLALYKLALQLNVEFTLSVAHDSAFFHTTDNTAALDPDWKAVVGWFSDLLLHSKRTSLRLRLKDWARAYIINGYIQHRTSSVRPLPCLAGSSFFTVEPFGRILPCNGMATNTSMGSILDTPFDELWASERAVRVRRQVAQCHYCWMICNAVPSMRAHPFRVGRWIVAQKLRSIVAASATRAPSGQPSLPSTQPSGAASGTDVCVR